MELVCSLVSNHSHMQIKSQIGCYIILVLRMVGCVVLENY